MDVVAAVLSGLVGVVAGATLKYRFDERARQRTESERIVQNYLIQLQDALESLMHRLINIDKRDGEAAFASQPYRRDSMRYIYATVLAQMRRLTLDGVYGHLEGQQRGSGSDLEQQLQKLANALSGIAHLQRYFQRELADAALDWSRDELRPIPYAEFRDRMNESQYAEMLRHADQTIKPDAKVPTALLEAIDDAAEMVATHTDKPVSYK